MTPAREEETSPENMKMNEQLTQCPEVGTSSNLACLRRRTKGKGAEALWVREGGGHYRYGLHLISGATGFAQRPDMTTCTAGTPDAPREGDGGGSKRGSQVRDGSKGQRGWKWV